MWPAVLLNTFVPILGMIVVSNICSAFGVNVFPEFPIIAALGTSVMALPMASSTLCFLIVMTVADMNMSGPPGLVAFIGMLIYLLLRLLTVRNPPQRFVMIALIAALATFVYHGILAFIYSLYYVDAPFGHLYLVHGWKYAILTALLAPPVIWLTYSLAGLFEKHQKRRTV